MWPREAKRKKIKHSIVVEMAQRNNWKASVSQLARIDWFHKMHLIKTRLDIVIDSAVLRSWCCTAQHSTQTKDSRAVQQINVVLFCLLPPDRHQSSHRIFYLSRLCLVPLLCSRFLSFSSFAFHSIFPSIFLRFHPLYHLFLLVSPCLFYAISICLKQ